MDDSNFFSLDRLVEFGMSAAIAQQMIGSMNQSMQQMFTPGSIQTMPQAQASRIYVGIDGVQHGPLSESDIVSLVQQKRITKDTLAWLPGMAAWKPIEQVPEVLRIIAMTPPPLVS